MNRPVTPTRTKAGRWKVDDEDLIQAAREGKEYAGPFLISLYAPMLLGYARGLASDLGDSGCEQICEWAVERAVRKIDLYDPAKGDFAGWARSMLRYAALDYRRDNARLQNIDNLDLAHQRRNPAARSPETLRLLSLKLSVSSVSPTRQSSPSVRSNSCQAKQSPHCWESPTPQYASATLARGSGSSGSPKTTNA